jgi:DNA-3-methyladenine glycosylase
VSVKLPQSFYDRHTSKVAKELLGKRLVRIYNGKRLSGIIVETEAYLGVKDAAAHTFGGRRTPRNEVMFGHGGHAYIYFIYGMHFCLNAVTRVAGRPEAVLIRALEISEGVDEIKKWRKVKKNQDLANGPGKLCTALKITRELNGEALWSKALFIEKTGPTISNEKIAKVPRVGVDYAGEAAKWPLRFYIKENKFISKK